MSILVFADNTDGNFKKTAFELVSFGKQLAQQSETSLSVLTINAGDTSVLSEYGADKILKIQDDRLNSFHAKAFADCIYQAAEKEGAHIVAVDSTNNGLYLSPILAVKLNAGYASNVIDFPNSLSPFIVKRKAFSSKGYKIQVLHF